IVGEIIDETDEEDAYITQLSDDEWRVDGRCPVEDVQHLGWPVVESDDYETVAGWLLDTLETVPKVGDEFEIDGFTFKVLFMRRRRIQSMRVKRVAPTSGEPEE
ncbi:MAG: HlyC/CorC family transporter, partial [Eggerthellaceae bacterium]|nr:HlyC/CorC family transporter [Eggerthellaceae bacterium]